MLNPRVGQRVGWAAALVLAMGARAQTTVTFQAGVSPTASYAGVRDVETYDGYSDAWQPGVNYVSFDDEVSGAGWDRATLIRWDLTAIPTTATVSSVSLIIYLTTTSADPYSLYECLQPWVANQATWNVYATGSAWASPGAQGAADFNSTALGTIVGAGYPATFTLNASAVSVVQKWVQTPSTNHGFVVQNYTQSYGAAWDDADNATANKRPDLHVVTNRGTFDFQNGVSPTTSYAGTTDTVIANGPDPKTLNKNTSGLHLGGSDNPYNSGFVIAFDLSAIPANATVDAASLSLSFWGGTTTDSYPIYPSLRPWVETAATWDTFDGTTAWGAGGMNSLTDHGSTVLGAVTYAKGTLTFPLNDAGVQLIQQWVSGAQVNDGFAVLNYAANGFAGGYDSEAATASDRPALTVTYTLASTDAGASDGGIAPPDGGSGGVDGGVPGSDGGADSGSLTDAGAPPADAGNASTDGGSGGPAFLSSPPPSAACGVPYQYQPQLSGPGPFTFIAFAGGPGQTLPYGLVVDPNTGAVRWTPGSDQAGPQQFQLDATSSGGVATQLVQIDVSCGQRQTSVGCGCEGGGFGLPALWALLLGLRIGRGARRRSSRRCR